MCIWSEISKYQIASRNVEVKLLDSKLMQYDMWKIYLYTYIFVLAFHENVKT